MLIRVRDMVCLGAGGVGCAGWWRGRMGNVMNIMVVRTTCTGEVDACSASKCPTHEKHLRCGGRWGCTAPCDRVATLTADCLLCARLDHAREVELKCKSCCAWTQVYHAKSVSRMISTSGAAVGLHRQRVCCSLLCARLDHHARGRVEVQIVLRIDAGASRQMSGAIGGRSSAGGG